jgi:hypothetical protein
MGVVCFIDTLSTPELASRQLALDSNLKLKAAGRVMSRKSTSGKSKGKSSRPLFDTIRKPVAPPGHPLSRAKPDEVARPAGRKAKHKRPAGVSDE